MRGRLPGLLPATSTLLSAPRARSPSLTFLAARTFLRTRLSDPSDRSSENKPPAMYLSLRCPCSPMPNVYRWKHQALTSYLRRSYIDTIMAVSRQMDSLPVGSPQVIVNHEDLQQPDSSCPALPLMKSRHQHITCSPCRRAKSCLPYLGLSIHNRCVATLQLAWSALSGTPQVQYVNRLAIRSLLARNTAITQHQGQPILTVLSMLTTTPM